MTAMFKREQVDETIAVAEATIAELRRRADDLDAALALVRSQRGTDSGTS